MKLTLNQTRFSIVAFLMLYILTVPASAQGWPDPPQTEEEYILYERYGSEIYGEYGPKSLSTLNQDGEYHINSQGQSYGTGTLHFMKEAPDLISAIGIGGTKGYIRESDTEITEADEENVKYIPLYDKEGNVLDDYFSVFVGSPQIPEGSTLEDVQELIVTKGRDTENTQSTNTLTSLIIGNEISSVSSYIIKENYYLKLRDIAIILSGTAKEFNLDWNPTRNTIYLSSNDSYPKVEMPIVSLDTSLKTAVPSDVTIFLDGQELYLSVYVIENSNYVHLGHFFEFLNIETISNQKNEMILDFS